jgi:hypothetical protein
MHFVTTLDEISHPVNGNGGAAVGHKKESHGSIMPHSATLVFIDPVIFTAKSAKNAKRE